ncbi:MAG: cell division protein ZipA [Porticoccaceae bacterium]
MNFGSREILITLGVLVVLGIILDGLRRIRSGREGILRSSIRKQPIFEDDFEERSSELPSGGARVVGYRDEETADQVNDEIRNAAEQEMYNVTRAFRELEQVPLGLEEVGLEDAGVEKSGVEDAGARTADNQSGKATNSNASQEADTLETVVLHLMSPADTLFAGKVLQQVLSSEGLHLSEQGIFHRHRLKNGSGPVRFSLANAINPGTFDGDTMDNFSSPGLTFFMVLEQTDEPLEVFDEMIISVQTIAKTLNGELKDEQRSTLTSQTIAHCRQQVVDYTRRMS